MTDDTPDLSAWLRERARQRRGRVSRDLDEASRAHHATADKLAAAADRLDAQQAEIERHKTRADNHAETLRGIAGMPDDDGPRMKLWARDGLSGYTNAREDSLLKALDERNVARAEIRQKDAEIERLTDDIEHLKALHSQGLREEGRLEAEIERQDAEIKRLRAERDRYQLTLRTIAADEDLSGLPTAAARIAKRELEGRS